MQNQRRPTNGKEPPDASPTHPRRQESPFSRIGNPRFEVETHNTRATADSERPLLSSPLTRFPFILPLNRVLWDNHWRASQNRHGQRLIV